jgi:hypothetical protein
MRGPTFAYGFFSFRQIRAGVAAAITLVMAGAVLLYGGPVGSARAASYTFFTLDNATAAEDADFHDANFNQLLGINNADIIVGYDGDGTVKPNKGYVLVPTSHYANENFPGSVQTQVTGLNNDNLAAAPGFTWTVGFWIDKNGNNFGFVNARGTYVPAAFPKTPVGATRPAKASRPISSSASTRRWSLSGFSWTRNATRTATATTS